jgi:hypothetical protein
MTKPEPPPLSVLWSFYYRLLCRLVIVLAGMMLIWEQAPKAGVGLGGTVFLNLAYYFGLDYLWLRLRL